MSKFFIAKAYNTAGNEIGCGPSKGLKPSTYDDAKAWGARQLHMQNTDHVVIFEALHKMERVQPVIDVKITPLLNVPKELETAPLARKIA